MERRALSNFVEVNEKCTLLVDSKLKLRQLVEAIGVSQGILVTILNDHLGTVFVQS